MVNFRNMMKETHLRSFFKGITWRIIATGDFVITLSVGFFEVIAKLLFYYLHERVWNRIRWGKYKKKNH